MRKKILFIYRADNVGTTGVNAYFKGLIEYLKFYYDIEEFFQPEHKSLFINFLYMIFIAPIASWKKSKKYDLVVITNDLLCNHILFCHKKSIVVFHHLKQPIEKKLNYTRTTFVDQVLEAYRRFTFIISTKAKRIVTPSKFTQAEYIDKAPHCKNKTEVIYNAFDIKDVYFDIKKKKDLFNRYNLEFNVEKRYLLFVGTEAPRKNFITLLKLLDKLSNSKYEVLKIGLARFEENRKEHLRFIEKYKLKVHFLDYVEDHDLIGFYKSCYCYINPSLFEGFGRTPIEAQIYGLPVISTIRGALNEVIENSCMIINDPYNLEEYIIAINKLANPEIKKKIQEKGLNNSKRFSSEKIFLYWKDLINLV